MSSEKKKDAGLGCLTLVIASFLCFAIGEMSWSVFNKLKNISTSSVIILLLLIIGQAMLIGSFGVLAFKKSSIAGKIFAGIGMFIGLYTVVIVIGLFIDCYIRR